MDVQGLKDAAKGRWREIFIAAGIGNEFLSGRHGPCPKCGTGENRFRAADLDCGWLLCNQCFSEKNGDGISSVQWWLGCDFKEAYKFVAEQVGFASNNGKAKWKRKPFKERVANNGPINEDLAAFFASNNQGVTHLGLQRVGAFNGTHNSQPVACFPCFGQDLKTLNNYVVMSMLSREVNLIDEKGNPAGTARKKTLDEGAGLMGAASMPLLATDGLVDVCWKTEGPSDLAALLGIIPDDKFSSGEHVAICNIHGAKEGPGWMAEILATRAKAVHIIHDADKDGQIGAKKWADAIARAGGTVKIVQLPYEIEEKKGKDLRDFINENGEHAFGRLLSLAADVKPEAATPPGETPDFVKAEIQTVLDRLAIDILGELETGEILIYSRGTRKMARCKNIDRLQRGAMVQVAGYAAINEIAEPGESSKEKLSLSDVRTAIAAAASKRRVDGADFQLHGAGVWGAENKVVLCNKRYLSIWDGETFVKQESPRVGPATFELGKLQWYDHARIEELLPRAADPEWCQEVWQRLHNYFDRWTWRDQGTAPGLLAALTGCTLCQAIWKWRPQIAITGASNTGKSSLYEFLFGADGSVGLFATLARTFAMSSEAGVRQTIGRNSFAIAIDEWDSLRGNRQREILNLLRTAGPASTVRLGTAHHHAMEFGLRHIVWLAGVHCGMDSEIDANRFLGFELVKPPPIRYQAWKSPTVLERQRMFDELLAIATRHSLEAARIAQDAFQRIELPGVHQRVIEGLCAPAAILAVSTGLGADGIRTLVERWAVSIQGEGIAQNDEQRAVEEILSLTVDKGGSQKVTVAEIVHKADYADSEYRKQLESQLGIAIAWRGDLKYLAVKSGIVFRRLGLDSAKSLTQILQRLPGAKSAEAKVAGVKSRTVIVPWDIVEKICDEMPDTDPQF